ncbi:unnamed protein product [Phytomonas sp. Hart1]|nr:unnamed protein product [Phytomonas sp. Hart1]|eukprot:CCW71039.1 unnamed protein product [Phytomonas sp. isolate Hart1]
MDEGIHEGGNGLDGGVNLRGVVRLHRTVQAPRDRLNPLISLTAEDLVKRIRRSAQVPAVFTRFLRDEAVMGRVVLQKHPARDFELDGDGGPPAYRRGVLNRNRHLTHKAFPRPARNHCAKFFRQLEEFVGYEPRVIWCGNWDGFTFSGMRG